ncbi:MAG: hypothetical protein ACR2FS_19500 [Phormidesmis sp.]
MDEQTLTEQFAKTGNIMDLCCDEGWVRESAQIEAECDGRIEAGLAMKAYAAAKYDDSLGGVRQGLRQQMRVQSILFCELRLWLEEWDIGGSFEDTYTEARQRVRGHLKQPSSALEGWVKAVLAEDEQAQELSEKPVRAQTRAQLFLMMTDEDWKILAQVAADIASASVLKASKADPQSIAAA